MKKVFSLLSFFLVGAFSTEAQTYCLGYDVVSVIGTEAVIQLKLQGSTTFNLGSSNFRFNYNNASLSSPALVAIAPANSVLLEPAPYSVINITQPSPSTVRFNVLLSTPNTGVAIDAAPAWTNLGRVRFTTMGASPTTALSFNPSFSIVYKDNETTIISSGTGCPSLDVPLPVEIISFDATKGKTNTLLTWKTVNALQMSHFDVERSQDGKTFAPIGQAVKAVNTIDKMSYNLTDEKPFAGINYYRLKSVEGSGKVAYSKVVSILFGTDFTAKAFPNPFHDVLTLDVKSDRIGSDMTFELIDVLGQQVAVQKRKVASGNVSVVFNTLELTAGSYIVRIKDADNVWQDKFVKY
jgi:Secretion system C-terminal sorting domain